jgi:hypothetical protein
MSSRRKSNNKEVEKVVPVGIESRQSTKEPDLYY